MSSRKLLCSSSVTAFLFTEEDSGELAKPKVGFQETAEEELGKYKLAFLRVLEM